MLRSEHGGLNETFADVAEITGDKKYLELARRFSHKVILDPLVKDEDRLTGMHANTHSSLLCLVNRCTSHSAPARRTRLKENCNHSSKFMTLVT